MKKSPFRSPRGVALIVAAALFMIFLDGTILVTSFPQMARTFGVSAVAMNSAVTAYLLAVAAFMPLSGWISDRFGAKRVFAAAVALFTLASVGCAVAPSFTLFLVARVLQGVAGALIMPIGRAISVQKVQKQEIMQATALITWPALIAPVLGPVLGGAISTWLDWRWNFLLNAPIGLLGVMLILAFIPDDRERLRRPLDIVGGVLTSTALILLIYALERLGAPGQAINSAVLLAIALALGLAAYVWLGRASHPILDLRPLRLTSFCVSTVDAGALQRVAINATPFLLPLMLQETWALNPWQAGLVLFAYFCGNLGMKSVTTPLLRRFGFRRVLVGNGLVVAGSVAACGLLVARTPLPVTAAVVLLAGAARSLQMTALNTLGLAETPGEQRAAAALLSSMGQQVAMALGVAAGAQLLHLAANLRGQATLSAGDFRFAFLAIGGIGLLGVALTFRLHPDAGWEVSGQAQRRRAAP